MKTINTLITELNAKKKALVDLRDRILPTKAGNMGVNFFKDNFRKGGYQDGSLHKWPVTRRQQIGGEGAGSAYSPLLSKRLNLMRSVRYTVSPGKTTILNDLVYAHIHNEGGTITHNVTPKMRKFAWAKFYEAAGENRKDTELNENAKFWKGMALTKKAQIRQVIPRRQFMGRSSELVENIKNMANTEIKNTLNK